MTTAVDQSLASCGLYGAAYGYRECELLKLLGQIKTIELQREPEAVTEMNHSLVNRCGTCGSSSRRC